MDERDPMRASPDPAHATPAASVADYARELLAAREVGQPLERITSRDPSFDVAAAYDVAAEILRRREARGERPIGRKIGFTNRTIWPEYGVWEPIWAHVFDTTVRFAVGGTATVALDGLVEPRIEPEIMLHFRTAPTATRDEQAILASIDWIAHGYEIVWSPFPAWKFAAADTIAAFGLHGALVVGRPVPVSGIPDCAAKLRDFRIVLKKDGVEQARGGGANVLDSPLLAFAHLAELLQGQPQFRPVAAGEIVSTGTLTAALPVVPGERWTTELLGIDLPGLELRLA